MSAKDARLYAKFTLDFPDHPKIKPLSDGAFRALHEMISYSCRLQTDGFIDRRLVGSKREAGALWCLEHVLELCNNDDENPSLEETPKGYVLHDFSDIQLTRADIEARRKVKQTAGQKGGVASGRSRRSKREAGASTSAKQTEAYRDRDRDREVTTNVVGSSSTETSTELTLVSGATKKIAPRASKRRTVPSDWVPSDAERARSREKYPDVDLRAELAKFIDHHQAKGSLFADLDAAWRTWLRNVQQYSANGTNGHALRGSARKAADWQNVIARMSNQPSSTQGEIQ